MKFRVAALVCLCLVGGLASAQAPPIGVARYEIVAIIDHPDAIGVAAWHLNEKGDVAGFFRTDPACNVPRVAFVWSNGEFRYITFPGAFSTTAEGVNNRGYVTGGFFVTAENACHRGFRQGYFVSPDGEFHTLPWTSLHSVVGSIAPNGWMTGPTLLCESPGGAGCQFGFLYNGRDEPVFLDPPGCHFNIDARDVNTRGDVVGLCGEDRTGPSHGFRYRNGAYEFIDLPGASDTQLLATNSAGDVIGNSRMTSTGEGVWFIGQRDRFAIIELVGVEGLVSFGVYDINEAGAIAGSLTGADGRGRGFIARPIR